MKSKTVFQGPTIGDRSNWRNTNSEIHFENYIICLNIGKHDLQIYLEITLHNMKKKVALARFDFIF